MFRTTMGWIVFASALSVCFAPAGAGAGEPRENSLQPGSWSIQFQIEDDIGLRPFNGMAISMKRHTSRVSAFRAAVNLRLEIDDSEQETSQFAADTLYADRGDGSDSNSQNVQIDFAYLRYPSPDARVNWFFGGGPLVRFQRSHQESWSESVYASSNDLRRTERDSRSRTWAMGVLGLAGVEWFASREISFHAEYRATFQYGKTHYESSRVDTQTSLPGEAQRFETDDDRSFWDFDSVNVLMGLSIYF